MTQQHARYAKLVALTLFLTFDLIVFGAFVRLTDSGLGCPDWPGCYAKFSPLQALDQIRAEEALRPDGAVTHFKAWIEMAHRYIAMILGMLCIAIAVLAYRWRNQFQTSPKLAAFILFWICVQGAFGALTVTLKLMPIIVTLHLLGAMLLLSCLAWLHVGLNIKNTKGSSPPLGTEPSLTSSPAMKDKLHSATLWTQVLLVMTVLQIALGGWVSTNYATLACSEYPLCQGVWIPPMDFAKGFALWRDLGTTATGEWLPFAALTAIHWVHRNTYWLVIAVAVLTLIRLKTLQKNESYFAWLINYRIGIMGVLTAQFLTGITNVVFQWPLIAAVLHNAGAALMVLVLVRLIARLVLSKENSAINKQISP